MEYDVIGDEGGERERGKEEEKCRDRGEGKCVRIRALNPLHKVLSERFETHRSRGPHSRTPYLYTLGVYQIWSTKKISK